MYETLRGVKAVIANGGQDSTVIKSRYGGDSISVYVAALTGVVTVYASNDYNEDANTGTFVEYLDEGGTNVTITAAKVRAIGRISAVAFRFRSSLAEGAERTFYLGMGNYQ